MAKFCSNCGNALVGAPKFCQNCGSPIVQAPNPAYAPAAQNSPAQSALMSAANHGTSNTKAAQTAASSQAAQGKNPPPPHGTQQAGSVPNQTDPKLPADSHPSRTTAAQPPHPSNDLRDQETSAGFGQPQYGGASYTDDGYVPDKGFAAMFFRHDNRLNRKRYILRSLALFAVAVVGMMIAAALRGTAGTLLSYLINFVVFVLALMLMIRRLHDLNRPTWWCIGTFIPILNFALGGYALFVAGTRGPNRYGPDPRVA
mgnify:CR=1 FL=1